MNDEAAGPAMYACDDGCGAEPQNVSGLASRYRPALLRYFVKHTGSHDDAEDLVQDTLVRLTQRPPAPDIANVEAWLFRVAANLLRDRFRRDTSHHRKDHLPIDELASECPSEVPTGDRVYEDRIRLNLFLQVLDELSPRTRQVFLLQRYEGLTYSAIAKRLEISVSGVEKHMMRALQHFNARLGER